MLQLDKFTQDIKISVKIMKPILTVLFCFLIVSFCHAQKNDNQKFPYKNSNLSVEVRVKDLLGRMTLEEKVSQMNMLSLSKLELDKNGKVSQESLEAFHSKEKASAHWRVLLSEWTKY